MMTLVITIAILTFIGWIIYRALTAKKVSKTVQERLRPHIIMYGLSCLAGICSYTFFLTSMDISKPIKIVVSIVVGGVLIFIAARMQRRAEVESH